MNLSALLDPLHDKMLDGLEFGRTAFELFEKVYQLPDEGTTLRGRRGDVKQLLEEVLPIARYVLAHYAHGQYISVRWIRGGQPFDAAIETRGARVEKGSWPATGTLEVTTAAHPKEYLMRERLNTHGAAFGLAGLTRVKGPGSTKSVDSVPTSHSMSETISGMACIVVQAIGAKASKVYPIHTTLVVNVELNSLYMKEDWLTLLDQVRAGAASTSAKFNSVFISADSAGFCADL